MAPKLDRKSVYGTTLLLVAICSITSRLSFSRTTTSVMGSLYFFRFWLEFGIGGDYPLSATIIFKYANKKTRDGFMAAVFAMQGLRILAGGIVTLVISTMFCKAFSTLVYLVDDMASTVSQADYMWHIILMLGAALVILMYYWRMKMPETAQYTALVTNNAKQAASDISKVLQVEIEAESNKPDDMNRKNDYDFEKPNLNIPWFICDE